YIEAMKKTNHPSLAESYYLMLRAFHSNSVGYDKIEELKLYIQNKFHDYKPIQDLGLTPAPKPSEEALRVAARLKEISAGRDYVVPQDTIIGAHITLSLPDMEGTYISTDSLINEYVLIDFWASWCAPCRKESPYLKKALSIYGSSFSIYAVTLDSDLNACMQAIERDGTEDFIHVKGILGGSFPCYAVRKLGIRGIPANFLLDKDRRIVAKNLRGGELLNMLEHLIQKK
ncbi:MAG: TlpA family protein disulfide reductase, partial [Bacteroides sp.]|nr:TlpA family protein disulfide reductase [Bacteroides sp.]